MNTYELFYNNNGQVIKTMTEEWSTVQAELKKYIGASARKVKKVAIPKVSDAINTTTIEENADYSKMDPLTVGVFKFNPSQLFSDGAQPDNYTANGEIQVVKFDGKGFTQLTYKHAERPHTINVVELYGIYQAAQLRLKQPTYKEVYCDNKNAVKWATTGIANISKTTKVTEYELFNNATGEVIEIKEGEAEAIDIYRKSKGLNWRKTGKAPRLIPNARYQEESELCKKMIEVIKKSGIEVKFWNNKAWGLHPADFGRKAV